MAKTKEDLETEVKDLTDALKAADKECLELQEKVALLESEEEKLKEAREELKEEIDEFYELTAGDEHILEGCKRIVALSRNPLDAMLLESFSKVLLQTGTLALTQMLDRMTEKRYRDIVSASDLL